MKKNNALGKGLSSLLGSKEKINFGEKELLFIDINKIFRNENQVRKNFDNESLNALAESIKRNGVIQPILLLKKDDKFQIIAGERRYRASKIAGLKEIPSIILDEDEMKLFEISLIENLQREDLNPIEEALAYKELVDLKKITHNEISNMIGKSRTYITTTISLLKLDKYVQECIIEKKISRGHAKLLVGLKSNEQKKYSDMIFEKNLSVRELEKILQNDKKEKKVNNKKIVNITDENENYIKDKLIDFFGTNVLIKLKEKNQKLQGKIEIEIYNSDDYNRILDLLNIER